MAKSARQTEVSDYDPQVEQANQAGPKLLTDSETASQAQQAPPQDDYKAKLNALETYLLHLDKREMLARSMLKDVLDLRKVTMGKMKTLMDENQALEKMPLLRQMIGID